MASKELIIDGSHYGGILRAIEHVLYSGYRATDTEIVCNEKELYTLRTIEEEPVIIATMVIRHGKVIMPI